MGDQSSPKARAKTKSIDRAKAAALPAGLTEDQRADFRQLIEDVYLTNTRKIMRLNFLRGMAFGLGTFLGGTIVVAIIIWILAQTIDLFPWARDFTERLIDSLNKK